MKEPQYRGVNELRRMFLEFFESKGHLAMKSFSLVPHNDNSLLLINSGMAPLKPYFTGQEIPPRKRVTTCQKCIRTGDIENIGKTARHGTFFEMLGNFSFGDYFKTEAIHWTWEFLTDVVGLDPDRLYPSVYLDDDEAFGIWNREIGIPAERIFKFGKEDNFWEHGSGPCGPCSEVYYDRGGAFGCGKPGCTVGCDCDRYIEVWNNVFTQFDNDGHGHYTELEHKNIDTGMGLERALCVLNGKSSVYETDIFADAIEKISQLTGRTYGADEETTRAFRVVLDHVRTATFMIGDEKGISPSNTDQGYILRRIIRRAVRYGRKIDLPEGSLSQIADTFVEKYKAVYPELETNRARIAEELEKEEAKFSKTLQQGLKEFEKCIGGLERKNAFMASKDHSYVPETVIAGKQAFHLYDTYGFPVEITAEMAKERGYGVDLDGYNAAFEEHQSKSKAGSEQKFACGLADHKEETTKLHTATHLLLAALKQVLSADVSQKGSNITEERLRFDFNFPRAMTPEEIKAVEALVNAKIAERIPVVMRELTLEEAKAEGFTGVFESKYGARVKTYSVGDFSREVCGGPHAENTGDLGVFTIVKEQSSGSGVRRIKAVLTH